MPRSSCDLFLKRGSLELSFLEGPLASLGGLIDIDLLLDLVGAAAAGVAAAGGAAAGVAGI